MWTTDLHLPQGNKQSRCKLLRKIWPTETLMDSTAPPKKNNLDQSKITQFSLYVQKVGETILFIDYI